MSDIYVLKCLEFYDDYKRADANCKVLGCFHSMSEACEAGCIAIESYMDELYRDELVSKWMMERFDLKVEDVDSDYDPNNSSDESESEVDIEMNDGISYINENTSVIDKFNIYCQLLERYVNVPVYTMKHGNYYDIQVVVQKQTTFKF